MIMFRNCKSNEVKTAFSFREEGEKIYIKFTENGKEYGYFKSNVKMLDSGGDKLPFRVYTYTKDCYKCGKPTQILTYITYSDKPEESLTYPWDKGRLLQNQNIFAHLADSGIEYYGLNVIGNTEAYDTLLMKKYPEKIRKIYSKTQNKIYPMNVCSHCGCGQGWYFVYRDINRMIKNNEKIEECGESLQTGA